MVMVVNGRMVRPVKDLSRTSWLGIQDLRKRDTSAFLASMGIVAA